MAGFRVDESREMDGATRRTFGKLRDYVDTSVSEGDNLRVLKAGDTMTGTLTVPALASSADLTLTPTGTLVLGNQRAWMVVGSNDVGLPATFSLTTTDTQVFLGAQYTAETGDLLDITFNTRIDTVSTGGVAVVLCQITGPSALNTTLTQRILRTGHNAGEQLVLSRRWRYQCNSGPGTYNVYMRTFRTGGSYNLNLDDTSVVSFLYSSR